MARLAVGAALTLLLSTGALADAISDAQQASTAFDAGDFAKALSLYTRASQGNDLSQSERVDILINRGVVYVRLGNRAAALRDFQAAERLAPNDPDIQEQLRLLQSAPARRTPARAVTPPAPSSERWGPYVHLVNRDWLGSVGKPTLYLRFEWSVPNAVLSYSGQDAFGKGMAGLITVDPVSGRLTEQATYGGKTTIGSIEVSADRAVNVSGEGSRQVQQLLVRAPEGYFQLITQKRSGNDWKTVQVIVLTPTTPQFVNSLGWPAAGSQQHTSFLAEIGRSLKGGALAGLHDGVQDGVHDAAQDRVRRLTGTKIAPTQTTRTVVSQ